MRGTLRSCGQVISVTSAGLLGIEGRGLGVLQGSRNCVIRYLGEKKVGSAQIPKSSAVLKEGFFFFYVLKEFSPGFDVTFPV